MKEEEKKRTLEREQLERRRAIEVFNELDQNSADLGATDEKHAPQQQPQPHGQQPCDVAPMSEFATEPEVKYFDVWRGFPLVF